MTTFTDRFQNGSFRGRRQAHSDHSTSAVAAAVGHIATMLLMWHERGRQRRQLLGLGDRELRDIGVSRAEAGSEGDKPFWRA